MKHRSIVSFKDSDDDGDNIIIVVGVDGGVGGVRGIVPVHTIIGDWSGVVVVVVMVPVDFIVGGVRGIVPVDFIADLCCEQTESIGAGCSSMIVLIKSSMLADTALIV